MSQSVKDALLDAATLRWNLRLYGRSYTASAVRALDNHAGEMLLAIKDGLADKASQAAFWAAHTAFLAVPGLREVRS